MKTPYQIPAGAFTENRALLDELHRSVGQLLYPKLQNVAELEEEALQRDNEKRWMELIQTGNTEYIDKIIARVNREGLSAASGKLSGDDVRQARYEAICAVTLFCRAATDSGLSEHLAYAISDCYIQAADALNDPVQLRLVTFCAMREYAQAMRIFKAPACGTTARECCEYIYAHMHRAITMQALSDFSGFSPNYLSDLFYKELGVRPMAYIRGVKLEYARILLRDPHRSVSDVAASLSFPSASAFSAQFKERYGVTPKEYRKSGTDE